MPEQNLAEQHISRLWALAAVARLAEAGLMEQAATEPVELAAQRLLVAGGWLTEEPIGPSEALRASLPPGLPVAAVTGYVRETLAQAARFADGAEPGWAETDPALIRWRGAGSGVLAAAIFNRCYPFLPGFPERLSTPGTAFLDVGTGAAGIAIGMCRAFPGLRAVGLDVSEPALAVARQETRAADLHDRLQIRAQSVAELTDEDAFDLLWVPQPFIPADVLEEALPRLLRAARPGAALVMVLSPDPQGQPAVELQNLMSGGGTLHQDTATALLEKAGFVEVHALPGAVMTAVRR